MLRTHRRLLLATLFLSVVAFAIGAGAIAGADNTEPSCTITGSASLTSGDIPSWSVTCVGVPSDEAQVIAQFPVSDGTDMVLIETASVAFGGGPPNTGLPSSFTVGSSSDQNGISVADGSATDNTDPAALYAEFDTNNWDTTTPTVAATGNYDTSGNPDDCIGTNTGCGTPDYSGFTDLDATTTTTTTLYTSQITTAADSATPGIALMGAGVIVIFPIVGLVLRRIARTLSGDN